MCEGGFFAYAEKEEGADAVCRWRLSAEFITLFPTTLQDLKPPAFDVK